VHGPRAIERRIIENIDGELPAPTTSTRLSLSCSFDFTSCECRISPSNLPGWTGWVGCQ
jgi:hypothetical protein